MPSFVKFLPPILAGLVLLSTASTCAAAPPRRTWSFAERDGGLAVICVGQRVAVYVYRDARILRPHLANLRTLDSVPVTRAHPPVEGQDALDHDTMHPGVWLGFGDLHGQDFWRNKARMEHVRFTEPPRTEAGWLTFATETRLQAADGTALGSLTNRHALVLLTNAWLLAWGATVRPEGVDLTFGDQEEMGFGARGATAIIEKSGGVITSSTGLKTARNTWDQPAAWCDYSGIEKRGDREAW